MRIPLFLVFASTALPLSAQNIDEGAAGFMAHCAGCHGAEARGDGPTAALLTLKPADLTGLAARNGGVFPTARVVQRIDGTTEVIAHGGPMPVFGMLIQGPSAALLAPDGSEVIAPEAIANIVAWLEGVQE